MSKQDILKHEIFRSLGVGLEPCNCFVGGRTDPRNNDKLEYLESGEIRDFDLSIELLSGKKQIDEFINYKN